LSPLSRSYSGSWITGDSGRQQTPKSCHRRNHGLCASISSCRRFAAEMSLALSGLISGASNISCSCSMSSMMRSTSIRLNIQHERGNRQTERTAKTPKTAVCPRIIPRIGQFGTVSELKPSHTLHDSLRKLRQSMDIHMNVVRSRYQARQRQ
jgi:hypothetical protein